MDKRIILLGIAALCIGLYFYGHQTKDNSYLKYLPTIVGLASGLNTLVGLAN